MLIDREKLEMGKAEIARVGRKLLGEVAIGQPFVVALAPPRAEMNLVDRNRRAQPVDARRRRLRMRDRRLVEHDRRCLGPHFRGKGHRIGLQRQMLAVGADDIEFIVVARPGVRDEQFPVADAAHAHRMAPRIPEIEIADHADPPRVGREHDEGDPVNAIERHRVRTELVVKTLVGALTQEIEIEIAQDRGEAVGIIEIDDVVAEAGPQLIALRAVRQGACEQPGVVNARELRGLAMFADRFHIGGLRQKGAHHAFIAFGMKAEIAEGVGVAALDDRVGLGGQFGHEASFAGSDRIRSMPINGTRSQSGRWASSYSIS